MVSAKKRKVRESKKLEVDIENDFCDFAKSAKCLAVKLVLLRLRGWPDRNVLCPGGIIVFFEFKRTKSTPMTTNQLKWQRILTGFGFPYYVCWDLNDAKRKLRRHL